MKGHNDICLWESVRKSWSYNQDFPIGQHEGTNLVSKKSDEQKIWQLMAALDRALDRCEETMRRTGHPILCWVNSGSRTRFYPKPFGFLGRAATRQRYGRLFQRAIRLPTLPGQIWSISSPAIPLWYWPSGGPRLDAVTHLLNPSTCWHNPGPQFQTLYTDFSSYIMNYWRIKYLFFTVL